MIKEDFAVSICEKMVCLAELDRGTAKDLLKFYMAMSSESTVQENSPELNRSEFSSRSSYSSLNNGRKGMGSKPGGLAAGIAARKFSIAERSEARKRATSDSYDDINNKLSKNSNSTPEQLKNSTNSNGCSKNNSPI